MRRNYYGEYIKLHMPVLLVLKKKLISSFQYVSKFLLCHTLLWVSDSRALQGFYLDNLQKIVLFCDDVEFIARVPPVAMKNLIAIFHKVANRHFLRFLAQFVVKRHTLSLLQNINPSEWLITGPRSLN